MYLTKLYFMCLVFMHNDVKVSSEIIQNVFKILPSIHVQNSDTMLIARSMFDCADTCLKTDNCSATTYSYDDKRCFLSTETPPGFVNVTEDTIVTLIFDAPIGEPSVKSHFGTTFMTGFMCNRNCNSSEGIPNLLIVPTVPDMTSVSVTIPYLQIYEEEHLLLNGFLHFNYTTSLLPTGTNVVSPLGIEILTDNPVAVYLINRGSSSTDGTLELPTEALGYMYIVDDAYNTFAQGTGHILVIAVSNNTEVTFELPSGYTETVGLNKFETYEFLAGNLDRLAGTIVSSNNPVTVHTGHGCVNIPDITVGYCDHILTTIPPVSALGRVFVVSYPYPRTEFSFGVVVPYNGTIVTVSDINGTEIEEISVSKQDTIFRSIYLSGSISITSNKNVFVTQYGHGGQNVFGDPSITIVPAVKQYVSRCTFAIPSLFNSPAVVSVTIRATYELADLQLNGLSAVITESTSILVPNEGVFNVVYIEIISDVTYVLYHVDPFATFGAILFARNEAEEFSTVLGLNL